MDWFQEAAVVVEGAVEKEFTIIGSQQKQEAQIRSLLDLVAYMAGRTGKHTEVYCLVHQHSPSNEPCECSQYVVEGLPGWQFN